MAVKVFTPELAPLAQVHTQDGFSINNNEVLLVTAQVGLVAPLVGQLHDKSALFHDRRDCPHLGLSASFLVVLR